MQRVADRATIFADDFHTAFADYVYFVGWLDAVIAQLRGVVLVLIEDNASDFFASDGSEEFCASFVCSAALFDGYAEGNLSRCFIVAKWLYAVWSGTG
jgi:hypothetical protein